MVCVYLTSAGARPAWPSTSWSIVMSEKTQEACPYLQRNGSPPCPERTEILVLQNHVPRAARPSWRACGRLSVAGGLAHGMGTDRARRHSSVVSTAQPGPSVWTQASSGQTLWFLPYTHAHRNPFHLYRVFPFSRTCPKFPDNSCVREVGPRHCR